MARLNEPPVSTDSAETLRRKLLRQNRDLAKLNNIRALRVRELENDCAYMLSENVELRGRIIELEKQVQNSETRRIAEHALAIKAKLESQLTEWGSLIAGLGLEPPPKRHSPRISRTSRRWSNTNFNRTSPSQRRLRDVAKDIEDLGHISEHKSYPRMSMNPEQIRALRSEADEADSTDSVDSPELGPPPMSQFIQDDPLKMDSFYASPSKQPEPRLEENMGSPVPLLSPRSDSQYDRSPSPQRKSDALSRPTNNELGSRECRPEEPKPNTPSMPQAPAATPTKAGIKRKFTLSDETSTTKPIKASNENQPPRLMASKSSIRDRTGGKTLKELTTIRKEERPTPKLNRKPLSAKSTNDDIGSPKKKPKQSKADEVTTVKTELKRSKATHDRLKAKTKALAPVQVEVVPEPETATGVPTVTSDLGTPLAEPDLLAPNSPISAAPADGSRGDTPPPAHISSNGETSRTSRRSRGVVSYAEPNLRDKMRRPTKDMVDAVTGARRSSHYELISHDSANIKRESSLGALSDQAAAQEPGSIPASPLARKSSSSHEMPSQAATDKKKRGSSAAIRENMAQDADTSKDESKDSVPISDSDLYEFTPSSPRAEKQGRRSTSRQGKSSRRYSTALENDDNYIPNERVSSRRRSMMV